LCRRAYILETVAVVSLVYSFEMLNSKLSLRIEKDLGEAKYIKRLMTNLILKRLQLLRCNDLFGSFDSKVCINFHILIKKYERSKK